MPQIARPDGLRDEANGGERGLHDADGLVEADDGDGRGLAIARGGALGDVAREAQELLAHVRGAKEPRELVGKQ